MKYGLYIEHSLLNTQRATGTVLFIKNRLENGEELPDEIIFSGGKTAGKDSPSEAESMKRIFLTRIGEIYTTSNELVIHSKGESIRAGQDIVTLSLEEDSSDTIHNVQNIMNNISGVQGKTKFILFSSLTHLPRISKIYRSFGVKELETSSLEAQYFRAGGAYRNYFWKHIFTTDFLIPAVLEIPKYLLTGFKSSKY